MIDQGVVGLIEGYGDLANLFLFTEVVSVMLFWAYPFPAHMFRSFFLFPLGSLDLTLFCRTSPRSAWTSHPVQWLFAA